MTILHKVNPLTTDKGQIKTTKPTVSWRQIRTNVSEINRSPRKVRTHQRTTRCHTPKYVYLQSQSDESLNPYAFMRGKNLSLHFKPCGL